MLSIEHLPCELVFHIFSYLTDRELCKIRFLNQKYKDMVDTPFLYSKNSFRIKSIWQDYIKYKNKYEKAQEKIKQFNQMEDKFRKKIENNKNCLFDDLLYSISKINGSSYFNCLNLVVVVCNKNQGIRKNK